MKKLESFQCSVFLLTLLGHIFFTDIRSVIQDAFTPSGFFFFLNWPITSLNEVFGTHELVPGSSDSLELSTKFLRSAFPPISRY